MEMVYKEKHSLILHVVVVVIARIIEEKGRVLLIFTIYFLTSLRIEREICVNVKGTEKREKLAIYI